ncbi:HalOD1 output domain-containing protein [Haloarchaeobius amylolyticus]|uniref:HalOD1 output domain-containing protein n=1 Tax=Haloarchaeobius amylolyticus TaxID=1198296 RepID=A0ABD6BIX0_9EURY
MIVQSTHSISLTVVEEIAKHEEVPPEELRPPLHSVIDTDALDSLFQSVAAERAPSTVEFAYNGYIVSIDETGDVDVTDHASAVEADKTAV